MKISLIATDLDGTLLSKESTVSDENLNAIKNLKSNNIITVPITGRTLYEIPEKIRNCDNFRYFVYSNGAGIYDKEKGNIFYTPIENETAKNIFNLLNSYDTLVELYSFGRPLIDKNKFSENAFDYYNVDKSFKRCMIETRVATDDFYNIFNNNDIKIEMFDVLFKNQDERQDCFYKIKSLYQDVEITTSMNNNLEIMKKGVNKGSALCALCKILDIDINFVIALGDSKNDISMFQKAGTKLAVNNACDELKNVADKTICNNNENVIDYLKKHLEV